jgi:4-hydroxy-4-methyl-2-oxoglutarate aldolase
MPGRIGGMTVLPEWLSATLASDGSAGLGVLPPWIRSPDVTLAGRALVVAVSRDDNAAMKLVPAAVTEPGTVLVIGGGGESRTAVLGDLVARELLAAGVVGVVTDGLIRDSRAVVELGLAVWARGVTPVASRKEARGHVGGSVPIGGVVVHDGDVVVADADGVVVWPAADVADLLARADAKRQADDERLAALTRQNGRFRDTVM